MILFCIVRFAQFFFLYPKGESIFYLHKVKLEAFIWLILTFFPFSIFLIFYEINIVTFPLKRPLKIPLKITHNLFRSSKQYYQIFQDVLVLLLCCLSLWDKISSCTSWQFLISIIWSLGVFYWIIQTWTSIIRNFTGWNGILGQARRTFTANGNSNKIAEEGEFFSECRLKVRQNIYKQILDIILNQYSLFI